MTIKLSGDMRNLLKSRIARHVDAVMVAQYMEGTHGVTSLAALNAGPALDVAEHFNIAVPTRAEGEEYARLRKAGKTKAEAQAIAEAESRRAGLLDNIRTPGANLAVAGGGALADDAEDEDEDAPVAAPVDPVDAAADADVKAVFAAFGRGDMAAFGEMLRDLAKRANDKPLPVPVALPYDTSKAGKRLHVATMTKVGIPAPVLNCADAETALPVYDGTNSPARDLDYVWPDFTAPILGALAAGRNIFTFGPAGTGKTTFAQQLAAFYGREFIRISCDDQTEAPVLVGMPTLTGWKDGQLSAAIRKPGAVILIDEPTAARAGALMMLHAVLDDDRALHVQDTGEVIPVAPDVMFILADNTNGTHDPSGQYEGTRIMNRATLDRCSMTVAFGYMDEATEAKAIQHRAKCPSRLAAHLAKLAALTRVKAQSGELRTALGMRRLVALAECMRKGAGASFAFSVCVLNTSTPDDAERLRQIWLAEFNPAAAGVAP